MYCNIRPCTTNSDCVIPSNRHSSGVSGTAHSPLQTEECYDASGFCRDWSWCPTIEQSSTTYLINDFSNLYLNVLPLSEINTRDSESYQVFGRPQRTNLQRLFGAYTANTSYIQEFGQMIEIRYEWECTTGEADDHDCGPDVTIRNETLTQSLIPNSSNRTTHQSYAYHYKIGDVNMRDEYNVRGVYIEIISTMKIKEIDLVKIINYIAFSITASMILHFLVELFMLNNPFSSREYLASLNRMKYYVDPRAVANENIYVHGGGNGSGSESDSDPDDEFNMNVLLNNDE
ncbi:unnamed protein product [Moneuplotes crassus]|uniref:Uncharacterized protein n=1 Tax=Euplotes crassus TaxID=5936 RepID=A0AAD1XGQ9_EUPCR|nr:unnamed protein product [Moneuplotes crassus]